MRKVVVFGLGRFGSSVAKRLYSEGVEVLAIDRSLKLVEQIDDHVSAAVACDATDRVNLEAYNISGMDAAVIAIGNNFESSVLITLLCRELEVPKVVAKALNPMQQRVLLEIGADLVVMPEEEMGLRLAEHLLHESVVDFVDLPPGYSLRRIAVSPDWVGQSLQDLDLMTKDKLVLIQIHRLPSEPDGEPVLIYPPQGQTVLAEGDLADVIGPDEVLQRFR